MASIEKIKLGTVTYDVKDANAARITDLPTVNNAYVSLQVEGTEKTKFYANDSTNRTFDVTLADLKLGEALRLIGNGQTTVPTAGNYIHDKTTGLYVSVTTTGTATEIDAKKGDVFISSGKEYVMITAGKYATPNASTELGNDTDTHRPIKLNGTEILGNNRTALDLVNGNNINMTNSNGVVTISATDTNTHRPIQMNGTEILGDNTTALNLKAGSNVTLSNSGGTVTIDAKDTTYSVATTSANGLMSSTDKSKLDGIASGAEVNQNAFSNIVVGSTTIAADTKTDSLTLVAGNNVTLTPDATNDKVTITATDTKYTAGTNVQISSSNVISATDTTYSAATTSAAGLMSAADKTKLDGIATGATKVTTDTVSGWGYTKNTGTVTSVAVKMNGTTAGTVTTSGTIDLGTVITAHQDISGKANASEAGYSLAVSGTSVSLKNKAGTVLSTITTQDNDTKNTAGSTDTSSKIYLVGATSQAANPQTYSDNEVYATNGVLTTKSVQLNGGSVTLQYADEAVKFVFA